MGILFTLKNHECYYGHLNSATFLRKFAKQISYRTFKYLSQLTISLDFIYVSVK